MTMTQGVDTTAMCESEMLLVHFWRGAIYFPCIPFNWQPRWLPLEATFVTAMEHRLAFHFTHLTSSTIVGSSVKTFRIHSTQKGSHMHTLPHSGLFCRYLMHNSNPGKTDGWHLNMSLLGTVLERTAKRGKLRDAHRWALCINFGLLRMCVEIPLFIVQHEGSTDS